MLFKDMEREPLPAYALIMDFVVPEMCETPFLYKLLGVWHFVAAAQVE